MLHTQYLSRALHDVGLGAWFGGSLMGATGLNKGADAAAEDERLLVSSAGWGRWTPVNLAAIAAHLVGGALLTAGNRRRVNHQQGVRQMVVLKTALTAAALGASAYARAVGKRMEAAAGASVDGTTKPSTSTPDDVAAAQRQERILQWVVPATTGALVVMGAVMGEQQRPQRVLSGVVDRLVPDFK